MRPTFQGSIVALVTPFRDGKVDEAKLRELVEWHVASGTDGIVPCGTTGESPTLTHDEHKRVVELVIETARGRLAVIAGTGSNSTAEATPGGSPAPSFLAAAWSGRTSPIWRTYSAEGMSSEASKRNPPWNADTTSSSSPPVNERLNTLSTARWASLARILSKEAAVQRKG